VGHGKPGVRLPTGGLPAHGILSGVADEAFFRARKAAAVLKHGVLSRYVLPFATKVGSTSEGHRVVVLDGYAGEGRYDDRTPGSPIFFAEAARKIAPRRTLELIFVEQKRGRYEKLQRVLSEEASDVAYEVWHGTVDEHLDVALARAAGVPLFAFLDPCGVGLPFTDISQRIFGRPDHQYAPATEVLLNFSAEAVRRIGGRLKEEEDAPGRGATLARMDSACGGDWWRDVYRAADSPERASAQIAARFASRLREATGAGSWVIGVRNAEHHQPKYALVFLTRHPDGLYLYGNAMSTSQREWRRAVVPFGSLLDDDEAFDLAEQQMADQWVDEIAGNIERLLGTSPSFRVNAKYAEVMGSTLGRARETHIRSALKRLQSAGVLSSNCVGAKKLQDHVVTKA
jgi:three-Cys-motif partner protein